MKKNLEVIQKIISEELSKNLSLEKPRVIAVSKKQPAEKVRQLCELGVLDFGENYLQEALDKMESLKDLNLHWHFIGNIQAKKIKQMVGKFNLIHSVSRLKEAEKISECSLELGIKQKILLQVNIADENTKQGFGIDQLFENLSSIDGLAGVELCGLMFFPPLTESESESLVWFQKAHDLYMKCKSTMGPSFSRLSMGTSQDFHLALRKGATDLRVGERLLGPRPRIV